MAIQTGQQFGDLKPSNNDVLTVLDGKEEKDMPKGYFQASNSDSLIEQWYNVQILKINQKLKNEIQKAADDLMAIVTLMDRNVAEFVTCS